MSWTSTVKKDLDLLGLTLDEALDLTRDRSEWRDYVLPHVLLQHEEGIR